MTCAHSPQNITTPALIESWGSDGGPGGIRTLDTISGILP